MGCQEPSEAAAGGSVHWDCCWEANLTAAAAPPPPPSASLTQLSGACQQESELTDNGV